MKIKKENEEATRVEYIKVHIYMYKRVDVPYLTAIEVVQLAIPPY
jgi:hypothetical protein